MCTGERQTYINQEMIQRNQLQHEMNTMRPIFNINQYMIAQSIKPIAHEWTNDNHMINPHLIQW